MKKGKLVKNGQGKVSLAAFMYYTVLSLAALAAVTAYSAGASLEAALLRAVMVLLISTLLGYALNIALCLSSTPSVPKTVVESARTSVSDDAGTSAPQPAEPERAGPEGTPVPMAA